jgi:hypothetical protein
VGCARVIEGDQERRCLMPVVIVLSPIAAILGFGLGASVVAGAGAGS